MKKIAFFAACLAVQAGYTLLLRRGFQRVRDAPPPPPSDAPVSVVVAARDEAERLPTLVAALDAQTHGHFEVVVVDDHSTDATPGMLRAWADRDDRVQIITHTGAAGKKHALTAGIAQARYPLLALTDADCAPPPTWLRALAGYARVPGETVAVCYCPYHARPGAVNALARYEAFVTGFLTAAAIGLERPYMAVGRGISYPRVLFDRMGGFSQHAHLVSGDDDLLVQAAARLPGVRVVHPVGKETYVFSEAPSSWKAWLRQKRRHLSDGPHYARSIQLHLGFFHTTALALWLAPLAGWTGAALLVARTGLWAWALHPAAQTLGARDLWRKLPLLEGGYALYNALLAPLSMAAGRLQRW